MYTDDPIFSVVGNDVLKRAMRCWHKTTTDFGLKMAIAQKRQVGSRLTWLGFNFYLSAGIISAAPEKLTRARENIQLILDGAVVVFDQYRKLLGLLEHLLLFLGGDRTMMYGLYGLNFERGLSYGPDTKMVFSALQIVRFQKWLAVLMNKGGCFFSQALSSYTVPLPTLPDVPFSTSDLFWPRPTNDDRFYLYSDAASESQFGGLGGFVHGEYWHHALCEDTRKFYLEILG